MISLAATEQSHGAVVIGCQPAGMTDREFRLHLLLAIHMAESTQYHHFAAALKQIYKRKFPEASK